MKYDVIIIGAGASGLYCAAHLPDKKVLIIEKNSRIGMKILASGSGQCNLTHGGYISAFYDHYGPRKAFVKFALNHHNNKQVISFYESHGLKCIERSDGKVFPESLKASDVVDTLARCIKKATLKKNEKVMRVEYLENHFKVFTDHGEYEGCELVIATGGRSYPALGSTGDGYGFAEHFGHSLRSVKPGLTGVVTRTKDFSELQGISLDTVIVSLYKSKSNEADGSPSLKQSVYNGPLLFTHFGLSGPVIINNSRYFDKGDLLTINFLGESYEVSEKFFIDTAKSHGDKPLAFYLNQIKLPEALKEKLIGVDRSIKMSVITKEKRKEILSHLTQYKVEIESLIGFNQAMVTVGGISHEEVDSKSMASKIQKGLYIVGEVVDVDGDTGGYNLQWAFSSGYLAAKSIGKYNSTDHD